MLASPFVQAVWNKPILGAIDSMCAYSDLMLATVFEHRVDAALTHNPGGNLLDVFMALSLNVEASSKPRAIE
jgi:hypothetical protein